MDIKGYISSGAIESCVLGLASPEEMQELQDLAARHPEVHEARVAFERSLEEQALAAAVAPPPSVKASFVQHMANARTEQATPSAPKAEAGRVIPITAAPKGVKWLRGAIAASVILLLGSAILNFYFYSQFKRYSGQYAELLAKQNTLLAKNESLQASYDMLKDTSMLQVPMKAPMPERAGSMATVLWDTKTKDVYLMVNNLPQHSNDHQYQLWAIVDGTPVDAGMIDMSHKDALIKMHNIQKAQAFAITLEKKGGSPTPTMEQMYVMGKV